MRGRDLGVGWGVLARRASPGVCTRMRLYGATWVPACCAGVCPRTLLLSVMVVCAANLLCPPDRHPPDRYPRLLPTDTAYEEAKAIACEIRRLHEQREVPLHEMVSG